MKVSRASLLVSVAVALCSLLGAASASASLLEATSYPTTIKGGPSSQSFGFKYATFECQNTTAEGNLAAASSNVVVHPTYPECIHYGTSGFNTSGCNYEYHIGKRVSPTTFEGTMDIVPTTCVMKRIDPACTVSIPGQTGLAATYTQEGSPTGKVRFSVATSKLKYTQTKGWYCSEGTFENGSFNGSWTFGPETLRIESEAQSARFEMAKYPGTVSGKQVEKEKAVFVMKSANNIKLECNSISMNGSLSSSATTMSVKPTFSGCTSFLGVNATVNSSGCDFVFHSAKANTTEGSVDLACSAGSAVTVSGSTCVVEIPAQSGLGTVEYRNELSGGSYGIHAYLKLTSVTYVKASDGAFCPLNGTGTHTDGTFTGGMLFSGEYTTESGASPNDLFVWGT
jgi:hypothetical protein